jgi:hypothetical protein
VWKRAYEMWNPGGNSVNSVGESTMDVSNPGANLVPHHSFQGRFWINKQTGEMYAFTPLPRECTVYKGKTTVD